MHCADKTCTGAESGFGYDTDFEASKKTENNMGRVQKEKRG